ncbi:polysaccharide pyruvyl transferase family protein [Paenibacillus macerans]|uniref:polysaccharide pyruvyl transferase family protein n=1 Tax=Paenibacillus macerans TaxID=44252 RepID=UPI003D31AB5A
MKVIIHGATNGSNYGDVLFADLFYRGACEALPSKDVLFMEMPHYGIGQFYRDELKYTNRMTLKDFFQADLLVYMSGGYFGETTPHFKDHLKRFFRYFWIGLFYLLRKKKVVICGVGGGPISNRMLLKVINFIMNRAMYITVRDHETQEYFLNKGVKNHIQVTCDTAQVIDQTMVEHIDLKEEETINQLFADQKLIFLHVGITPKDDVKFQNIVEGLNRFLRKHPEYGVIFGNDGKSNFDINQFKSIKSLQCEKKYFYKYSGAWQLTALLNKVDFVITPKLHVGIISSSLGKSVVSFPVHKQKTLRYYRQIGEEGRCKLFSEVNPEIVEQMIETYHDKPITIDDSIRRTAKMNIEVMKSAIQTARMESSNKYEKAYSK